MVLDDLSTGRLANNEHHLSNDALSETSDRVLGSPYKSRWAYATAKAFGEHLAYGYHREQGAKVVVTRLFNTVGPRQTGAYGMVLPRFVRQGSRAPDCLSEIWAIIKRCRSGVNDPDGGHEDARPRQRHAVALLPACVRRWGYRCAHGELLLEGFCLKRKRTQRIWREEGLRVPRKARKRRRLGVSTPEGAERLSATHPNHVWALDFQHDASTDGRELNLLNIVDEFSREALAIECGHPIDADETVATLERLVAERGVAPENLRADNRPELTARVMREWCEPGSIATAYIDPGAPWHNAWVDSFSARLRDELLDVEELSTPAEAQLLAGGYRDDYNRNHHHSALGMMAPSRFAASWQRNGPATPSINPELSHGVVR